MSQPWETDNCNAIKAHYAVYSIPQAAALWCGIAEGQVSQILEEATVLSKTGLGRSIWKHPNVPCLEFRCRAITEAIENGLLPHGREDGKSTNGQYVAHERRHFFGRDLKKWMEKEFPNEKPAFLFDDIERSSHTAISTDAYRSLKAEHDKLKMRLGNAKSEYKKLRQEKDEVESERSSLKSKLSSLNKNIEKHTSSREIQTQLTESTYWVKFSSMASKAIREYPEWKKTQRQVQKTANLIDWLKNSIGADNRESEILKKVLSDFYIELR